MALMYVSFESNAGLPMIGAGSAYADEIQAVMTHYIIPHCRYPRRLGRSKPGFITHDGIGSIRPGYFGGTSRNVAVRPFIGLM